MSRSEKPGKSDDAWKTQAIKSAEKLLLRFHPLLAFILIASISVAVAICWFKPTTECAAIVACVTMALACLGVYVTRAKS